MLRMHERLLRIRRIWFVKFIGVLLFGCGRRVWRPVLRVKIVVGNGPGDPFYVLTGRETRTTF